MDHTVYKYYCLFLKHRVNRMKFFDKEIKIYVISLANT